MHGRVLVVDDDEALLDIYADLLREAGYEVETARNGREALQRLDSQHPDVLLTDIRMPDTDGIQLLRAIRERDLDLPVLLATGSPTIETAVQAVELGALQYLLKPVTGATLREAVGRAVRLRRIAELKREALLHLGHRDKLVGDRAGLQASLGRAMESLYMVYQPVRHAVTGTLYAQEALVRSREAMLPDPAALFGAAERLGATGELGRLLRRAVATSPHVVAGGTVFVNVHPRDLTDDELFASESPLAQRARQVVLELTERAPLDTVPDLRGRVRRLRDLGFRMALDDLGAGYAGLSSFTALQPEIAKLDMSLVRGMDADPVKRTLVGSMARLCKELGVLVVAEGIETAAECEAAVACGCDLLQGFWIGAPSAG
jgi:EAL domain-containing protein (putative c-di-GMP-specific phosphodiesterase class I)